MANDFFHGRIQEQVRDHIVPKETLAVLNLESPFQYSGISIPIQECLSGNLKSPFQYLTTKYRNASPEARSFKHCDLKNPNYKAAELHISNWDNKGTRSVGFFSIVANNSLANKTQIHNMP